MDNVEEQFDSLFDAPAVADREERSVQEKAPIQALNWTILKVPRRKNLASEILEGKATLYEWSNGSRSILIDDTLYDVIPNQDTREVYGVVDSNTQTIHFGLDYQKAVLRPTFKGLSKSSFDEKRQARIKITQAESGRKKSKSATPSNKSRHGKFAGSEEDDDLEDFLEDDGDSGDDDGIF